MNDRLEASAWPAARLGEAIEVLARRAGLDPASAERPGMVPAADAESFLNWIDGAVRRLGIEAEPVEASVAGFSAMLQASPPALLCWRTTDAEHWLAVVRASRRAAWLLGPDLRTRRCRITDLMAALTADLAEAEAEPIEAVLNSAGIAAPRRPDVRAALLQQRLASRRIDGIWLLRLPPQTEFGRQLRDAGLIGRAGWILTVFGALYALEILGWAVIGEGALSGRLNWGLLIAWVLLVVSLIPLQWLGHWLEASVALDVGRLLKQRLLAGALAMDPEQMRHQGAGQLLGRVIESQALESLALNGGLAVLTALIELAFAGGVLWFGAGGSFHLALFAGWLALTAALAWRYFRRLRTWTLTRLDLTHDLVERMVGHRTCVAQEPPGRRDDRDDRSIEAYFEASGQMDRAIVPLLSAMPRGWLIVGLAGLLPAFVSGTSAAGTLAIGLGGILLAGRALSGAAGGLAALSRALVAWSQVAHLFRAGARLTDKESSPLGALADADSAGKGSVLVDASELSFRYRPTGAPVLDGVGLRILRGERILLEGASGGGKSTLASLLLGLRIPKSGLILLNGLDRHTLGEAWRSLVTGAPQFHENHVLPATLAFNLLMGRRWPPTEADLAEAEALCLELGLGDLLNRMPSGLMQRVGETGWQLSHGERSRIFLARALLQGVPLTVLDESFAALDPETLRQCLHCAVDRADTLLVIAHP